MKTEDFAAKRRESLLTADDRLAPVVQEGLVAYADGSSDWHDNIVDEAADVWLEYFQAEAPGANFERALERFREMIAEYLDRTAELDEVTTADVNRVTRWLSTYTVNAATIQGSYSAGVRFKSWLTMGDEDVRDVHARLNGQVRPIGGSFNVGGYSLAYPGEPVGPPEVWIQCRCVAQPAALTGQTSTPSTFILGEARYDAVDGEEPIVATETESGTFAAEIDPDVELTYVDEDLPEDEPDDDEDVVEEIPIHGVLAVEGMLTGDNRGFRNGALSTRPLPIPYRYEYTSSHGGNGTSEVATVGRIDEAWLHEDGVHFRFKGVIIMSKEYAGQALEAIIDGSGTGVSIDADAMVQDVSMYVNDDGTPIEQAFDPATAGAAPETWYSTARVAGLTQVPIPAFVEVYVGLGHEFEEDMTPEAIAAAGAILADCGCAEPIEDYQIVDVSGDPEANARAEAEAAALLTVQNLDSPAAAGKILSVREIVEMAQRGELPDTVNLDDYDLKGPDVFTEVLTEAMKTPLAKFAPGTKDGPGWITHPVATSRIRRYWTHGKGAAKIKWGAPGDFNRCRRQLAKYVQNPEWLAGLCANMHKEALGIWPSTHAAKDKGRHSLLASGALPAPIMTLREEDREPILAGAGGVKYPAEAFTNPNFDRLTSMHIDRETRRIWGHLASWKSCHIGVAGTCLKAPKSPTGYANYRKGVVDTEAGEQRVACITYGIGHANPAMRPAAATAHYDKPDAVRAYVNVGEDAHGIWFNGVLAPWTTEEDIDAMRAIGSLSGDWRYFPGVGYDLIAAVAVNTPGYQMGIAASGGIQTTLILSNVEPEPLEGFAVDADMDENEAYLARAIARALAIIETGKRAERVRERAHALRLADVRARAERV